MPVKGFAVCAARATTQTSPQHAMLCYLATPTFYLLRKLELGGVVIGELAHGEYGWNGSGL